MRTEVAPKQLNTNTMASIFRAAVGKKKNKKKKQFGSTSDASLGSRKNGRHGEIHMRSMWKLVFLIVALLFMKAEAFAQQATPMDYAAIIRSVSSLNADGLESKNSREENCKPLPAEMVVQCRSHMDTIGNSRLRLDQAITAVEEAAKKGSVDRKILQRLDSQINAYVSLRNFIFLWLEDK